VWTNQYELGRHSALTHNTQFAGVWKILSVPYDGHTAVVSASSDGSVRTGFLFHSMFLRGAACEVYSQELVRVNEAKEEVETNIRSSSSSSGGGRKHGVVSLILDQTNIHNKNLNTIQKTFIPSASVAMHTVDCCSLDTNADQLERLFVYGGASGVLRVHTNNLKWEATLN